MTYYAIRASDSRSGALGEPVPGVTPREAAESLVEGLDAKDGVIVRWDVRYDLEEVGGWASARSTEFTAVELGVVPRRRRAKK